MFAMKPAARLPPVVISNVNPATPMSRTTVRVDLPNASPDDLVKLLNDIATEHARRETAEAGSSPLDSDLVAHLKTIADSAGADRAKAHSLSQQSSVLMDESATALGLAVGQTLRSEGTGVFLAAQVRDLLLAQFRGTENELQLFGFNVVIGSAAGPKPKAAVAAAH